jgi:hypothetical protein
MVQMKRTALALALALTVLMSSVIIVHPAKSSPRTIVVPDVFPTIREAVRNATAGDTVYVRAGNYTIPPAWEYGIEIGSSVTLRGENPNTTIIATTEMTSLAFGVGYGIVLRDNAEISGFTITGNLRVLGLFGNGRISNNIINLTANGSIAIIAGSGIISSNIINGGREGMGIQNPVGGLTGGNMGIEAEGDTANTTISNNIINGFGSGIYVWGGSLMITNNTFTDNYLALAVSGTLALLQGNNIVNSTAYGLYATTDVNASYNWWGTNDASTVSNSVTTGKHTANITFTPFLTEPNSQAVPIESSFAPPVLPSSAMDVPYWTVAVVTVLVTAAIIGIGLLVYVKKRKR